MINDGWVLAKDEKVDCCVVFWRRLDVIGGCFFLRGCWSMSSVAVFLARMLVVMSQDEMSDRRSSDVIGNNVCQHFWRGLVMMCGRCSKSE